MPQPITFDSGLRWDTPGLFWDGLTPEPPHPMTPTPVTYAVEDVMGFGSSAKAMLNTYKTQMQALGVDPTALLAGLDSSGTDLNTKNAAQENLKTQLRDQTVLVQTANNLHYAKASNACDLVISAFGRTSEQAKEATNLRKGIRPAKNSPTPPTPP